MKEILEKMIANYQKKYEQSLANEKGTELHWMKTRFMAQYQCYEEIRNDLINYMLIFKTELK